MTKNELLPGVPRLGWFVDGDPSTERIAVMLQDTGNAIELTIPLKGLLAKDDPYGRWWSSRVAFGDDPDRTRHSYRPPRVLLIDDAHGPVVLVGCRSTSSSSSTSVGRGIIVANFAVLGGSHLRYEKIDGLRTEIPALTAWAHLSNMSITTATDKDNRLRSIEMKLTDAEPVSLARPLNLKMRSTWRTETPLGGFIAHEGIELETSVKRPRSWEEHIQLHEAVLELASIAAWAPFGFSSLKVKRIDDPLRNAAGGSLGERWLPVVSHRFPKHAPWKKTPRFLFPYNEVGPQGVSRWLRLRQTYGRVIGPLLNVLRSEHRWGHPSLVQSGIALEALGYLVDVEKNGGAHLNSRNQMNFKPGLRVILEDMAVRPFADVDGWIDRADAAYMGAKHPDRPEPDSLEQINTLRDNLLVLRFWIGLQLGVKPSSLCKALPTDRLARVVVTQDYQGD